MFGVRMIEVLRDFGKGGKVRELEERLAKAEAAADLGTKIVKTLHFAGDCEDADWRAEPTEGCITFEGMVNELLGTYNTKEVYELAWIGYPWPGEAEEVPDCAYNESWYSEEPTCPMPQELAGRKVIGGEWDAHENGWQLKVKPNGPYIDGCVFNCYSDCSGSMLGPNGEEMADWDMYPFELDLYSPGDKYPTSLCNPYEPGGADVCRDIGLLLETLEKEAIRYWPDLTLQDETV